ncbi:MAG: CoB--CoM heterodisulfide reductase iron-sulfur subunit A family protein, partial [Chloroflexi bacterium]|nr:CoB--CoM heterodisulfide reductase iron-sulfur subunit A family protein [Chloroflexota bacterium]
MASNPQTQVLVIGSGLSGLASALLLADWGYGVALVERGASIGGSFHLLDRTFPTDSCGLCFLEPGPAPAYCPTLECGRHPNLRLLPLTDVLRVEGQAGDFAVALRRRPRYVREDRCNGCGLCAQVCPAQRPDLYEGSLAPQRAIYAPPARAMPSAWAIDPNACTRCGACVPACPRGAIDLETPETLETLQVAALIASPGFTPFHPAGKPEYGWGRLRNVVSAIQFERLQSLSGSSGGRLRRPSDGESARRIAFIQCVGSRDEQAGRPWCSSVCCMYTAKQASLALQMAPDSEAHVFFIDLRTFGKEFDAYQGQAEARPRLHYHRGLVSALRESPDGQVEVVYGGAGGRTEAAQFDLAVLAVGLEPPAGAADLAAALGIGLDPWGFPLAAPWDPLATSRPGVVAAGAFREPKDIPDTVTEAAAAAGAAAAWVGPPQPASALVGIEPRAWDDEPPRTGVFLCACQDLREGLPLERLAEQAAALPGVAHVRLVPDLCHNGNLDALLQPVAEQGLNRIVVGGCSPREVEAALRGVAERARLAPACVEAVNLREGCAWLYPGQPGVAQAQALGMLRMAAARLQRLPDLRRSTQPTAARGQAVPGGSAALVLGGGAAGMTAALALAGWGVPVHLVEQAAELGGLLRRIGRTADGQPVQPFLARLRSQVQAARGIALHLGSRLTQCQGDAGSYRSRLEGPDGSETWVEHGAVVVAVGGQEGQTTLYRRGAHPAVLTQPEMAQRLDGGTLGDPQRVVMVQCAGQRGQEREGCSRFCCTQAVANALALKARFPGCQVVVFYRDLRTYGLKERLYRQAREQEVLFLRYEADQPPQVEEVEGALWVAAHDPELGRPLRLPADWVVLSSGAQAGPHADLAAALGVQLDTAGYFQEEHPKMRPVDLGRPGMFVCG